MLQRIILIFIVAISIVVVIIGYRFQEISSDKTTSQSSLAAAVINSDSKNELTELFKDEKDFIKPLDAYADNIPKKGNLIVVDLGTSEIKMYKDGRLFDETKLKSKGQIGSFWQTPTGYYEITYANPNHISSIGNVNMPYSLQYSGNFFIHGWPTYLDGTPVDEGYSGGCIRLETDNAAKVFDFAPTGSKVLIVNSNNLKESEHQLSLTDINFKSDSFLVANLVTGEVYSGKNYRDQNKPMGRLSNFIVAITANEWISYNTQVKQYVKDGNIFKSQGLSLVPKSMYLYLLNNSTQADEVNFAIANHRGKWFFAEKATQKHKAIGMDETLLLTDLSQNNAIIEYSAPIDEWFHLVRYLYFQKKFLLDAANDLAANNSNVKVFQNKNPINQSGFAIITPEKLDPLVLISTDTQDLLSLADTVLESISVN